MRIVVVATEAERRAAFAVRRAVFIEEQAIPEAEEWDEADAVATHFLAEDGGRPAATARLIPADDVAKIGRVATMPQWRGTGLGKRLMRHVMDHARSLGFATAVLDAQLQAIPFYETLGFAAEGTEFDDGSGILHRHMRRELGPADIIDPASANRDAAAPREA